MGWEYWEVDIGAAEWWVLTNKRNMRPTLSTDSLKFHALPCRPEPAPIFRLRARNGLM